ncbi:hypothetical protein MPLDJ20_40042 [Mesorhizobium plurifarium]|uniref:Uncharacterized protein n=1 Tax=Mesorhizobium plurifarium TaxID=69974 RepID=A0A090FJ36_MESPL|nr:hypothetical protein MPLDJ20_40042 [Mesorhizobium plurifarium]
MSAAQAAGGNMLAITIPAARKNLMRKSPKLILAGAAMADFAAAVLDGRAPALDGRARFEIDWECGAAATNTDPNDHSLDRVALGLDWGAFWLLFGRPPLAQSC